MRLPWYVCVAASLGLGVASAVSGTIYYRGTMVVDVAWQAALGALTISAGLTALVWPFFLEDNGGVTAFVLTASAVFGEVLGCTAYFRSVDAMTAIVHAVSGYGLIVAGVLIAAGGLGCVCLVGYWFRLLTVRNTPSRQGDKLPQVVVQ